MIKSLYWRINFFLKRQKSKQIRKKLGSNVQSIIVNSKNGILAMDPEDLEVGHQLRVNGSFGLSEISRINQLVDENSNVLIVGGHIGSLAIPVSKFVNKCTVIEASPKTYELLKTNILLNDCDNITAHNIAASDAKGKIKFQMNSVNSGGSKRLPINNEFMYRYDDPEVIEVESESLDVLLQGQSFDLILLDIEGSEYFAMKGMPVLLSNCNNLIVEFLPHHLTNVADITVKQFLENIPAQMKFLTIPSRNETYPIDVGGIILQEMFNKNLGDDGILFHKEKLQEVT